MVDVCLTCRVFTFFLKKLVVVFKHCKTQVTGMNLKCTEVNLNNKCLLNDDSNVWSTWQVWCLLRRHFFLYSWFRASWLYINKIQRYATVCRGLFTAKLLYVFRVSIAPIIRSISNCNCSFWYVISRVSVTTFRQRGLIRPNKATLAEGCCSDTWYDVLEAEVTVWYTPDNGYDRHPKHEE